MPLRPPEEIDVGLVVVRRWRLEDADALHAAVRDSIEHLRPWMGWIADEPISLEQRRQKVDDWCRAWDAAEDFAFAIDRDGEVVGALGLHRRIAAGGLEIGYWVRNGWTGRGFARAAAGTVTEAALALDGTTHVEIHHDVANDRSRRIPEALGYRLVEQREKVPAAPAETGTECVWRIDR